MDNCWRCGRRDHAPWCSMPGGCTHCGWEPHRWWCLGPDLVFPGLNAGVNTPEIRVWNRGGWGMDRIPEPL